MGMSQTRMRSQFLGSKFKTFSCIHHHALPWFPRGPSIACCWLVWVGGQGKGKEKDGLAGHHLTPSRVFPLPPRDHQPLAWVLPSLLSAPLSLNPPSLRPFLCFLLCKPIPHILLHPLYRLGPQKQSWGALLTQTFQCPLPPVT